MIHSAHADSPGQHQQTSHALGLTSWPLTRGLSTMVYIGKKSTMLIFLLKYSDTLNNLCSTLAQCTRLKQSCFLSSQRSDYHWGFPPPALQRHRLRSHGYRCWLPQQRPVLSSWRLPQCLHQTVSALFTHLSVDLSIHALRYTTYSLMSG